MYIEPVVFLFQRLNERIFFNGADAEDALKPTYNLKRSASFSANSSHYWMYLDETLCETLSEDMRCRLGCQRVTKIVNDVENGRRKVGYSLWSNISLYSSHFQAYLYHFR